MDAPEFAQFLVPNDHAIVKVLLHRNRHVMLMRLLNPEITDDEFDTLLTHIKTFLRLVKRKNLKYHFVIDVHTIENIPYMRLIELQTWLTTKRTVLVQHLHNTVIITQSDAMKAVVDVSMLIYEPSRPFSIYVAHPPQQFDAVGIPAVLANEVYSFMDTNLNPTADVDVANLPRADPQ